MSHYAEMKCDFLQKNEADMVAALEMVFGEGNVEVHEKGAALYGYQGDNRAEAGPKSKNYAPPCHVIIRRKHVGSAANDIGYRRNEEGGYEAYVSDYDSTATFPEKKRNLVAQEYAASVASRKLKAQGYMVKRTTTSTGQVKLTASKWSR